jgi:hypothetical protein
MPLAPVVLRVSVINGTKVTTLPVPVADAVPAIDDPGAGGGHGFGSGKTKAHPGPEPCEVKVKPEATVAGSIGSLKVAETFVLTGTPVFVSIGSVGRTAVGAVASPAAPVVKVHTVLAANALPARSLIPVVTVAV